VVEIGEEKHRDGVVFIESPTLLRSCDAVIIKSGRQAQHGKSRWTRP
jgi:hypothetical protein